MRLSSKRFSGGNRWSKSRVASIYAGFSMAAKVILKFRNKILLIFIFIKIL